MRPPQIAHTFFGEAAYSQEQFLENVCESGKVLSIVSRKSPEKGEKSERVVHHGGVVLLLEGFSGTNLSRQVDDCPVGGGRGARPSGSVDLG